MCLETGDTQAIAVESDFEEELTSHQEALRGATAPGAPQSLPIGGGRVQGCEGFLPISRDPRPPVGPPTLCEVHPAMVEWLGLPHQSHGSHCGSRKAVVKNVRGSSTRASQVVRVAARPELPVLPVRQAFLKHRGGTGQPGLSCSYR